MDHSRLTREGLAAAKARGVALGSARQSHWKGREDRREQGRRKAVKAASAARSKAASEAYSFLMPTIREQRERGDSLACIADRLNAEGHTTRTGKAFSAATLHHLLARVASC